MPRWPGVPPISRGPERRVGRRKVQSLPLPMVWRSRGPRPMAASDAFSLLGLARRAGTVLVGTDAVRRSIRNGDARLVILAGDASPVQLEKVFRLLRHHEIPHVTVAD